MHPDESLDESPLLHPLGILEPPEQHARLHRQIGPGGELDVETAVDPAGALERAKPLGDRARRLRDDGALVGRGGALTTEADPIGLGMIPGELDRSGDRRPDLVGEDPARSSDRDLSGGSQAGEGAELELAKKRVLVRVVKVESPDAETGSPGDGIAVDPFTAVSREQPESRDEQSRLGVLESGSRHGPTLTD